MMNRGELLRKLRQLEKEDEASRETSSEELDDYGVLVYENFLNSQSFYDDYKHVNYRTIDFGNIVACL